MSMKFPIYLTWLFLLPLFVLAQDRKLTGTVRDENGMPLNGVTVTAQGANVRSITDEKGRFAISVGNAVKTLMITHVGQTDMELRLTAKNDYQVTMQPAASTLSDVVVIGYGSVRKTDLTGSVQQIRREDLMRDNPISIQQAMQGKLAGVNITQNDGAPGAGLSIRIRGSNSFLGGTEPLYVIDGVPFNNSNSGGTPSSIGGDEKQTLNILAFINPNDIETIDILKDASATAIYGSRGANGVVLITTRKGRTGRDRVELNVNVGAAEVSKRLAMLRPYDYARFQNLSYFNANRYDGTSYTLPYTQAELDTLMTDNTNWQNAIFRMGLSQQYSLNVSGSGENGSHSLTFNYLNQDGTIINSDFRKFGLSANLNRNVGKNLRIGTSTVLSNSTTNGVKTGTDKSDAASAGVIRAALTYPSTISREEEFDGNGEGFFITNPKIYSRDVLNRVTGYNIFSSNYAELSFLKHFKLRQNLGFNYGSNDRDQYYPRSVYEGFSVKGSAMKSDNLWTSMVSESILSFNRKVGKHSLNAMSAGTFERTNGSSSRVEAKGFPNDLLKNENMQAADQILPSITNRYQSTLISFLGRANYAYDDRYLLTVSFRQDGSSKFGRNNKWAGFPSAALAWKIHNEGFLEKNKTISNLTARVSYGETGNQGIGSYASLAKLAVYNYPFNGTLQTGLADDVFAGPANADLKWETTSSYNAGIDLGIMKDRVNLHIDAYLKRTDNLLQYITTPGSSGFQRQLRNSGSVQNKGLELALDAVIVKDSRFQWKSLFNISFNRNKILSLGGDVKEQFASNISTRDAPFIQIAGMPIGTLFGFVEDGYFDNEAEVRSNPIYTNQPASIIRRMIGEIKYRNLDGDLSSISNTDRTFIGDVNPDYIFGFTNNFTYGKFDLSIFINGVQGNDVVNMNSVWNANIGTSKNVSETMLAGTWTDGKDNTMATHPKAIRQFWRTVFFSRRFIEDGSFVRVKNVTVGYNMPARSIKGINTLRVSLGVNNLYTFTKYSGFDPEVNSYGDNPALFGVDLGGYPNNRTYTLSLRCGF
jgi:TonB-linked SusC/RagA family outer membrane protein